jgi:putative ABC transport system permease protein
MRGFLQDVRYALRQLRRSPGFTTVAIATLALGIGADTAIFSVIYGILLRPLPYSHPERIVELCESYHNERYGKRLSYPDFQFLRARASGFESLAAITNVGFNLTSGNSTERVNGLHVSWDYFSVLGVPPLVGRTFFPEEDGGDGQPVAILSERLWKRMGHDRRVLGRTVLLDGLPFVVIGVMPADFERLNTPLTRGETEVWAPLAVVGRTVGTGQNLTIIGRIKDGVSLDQARAQLAMLSDIFHKTFPGELAPVSRFDLENYQTMLSGDFRTILIVLFGAVSFVFLIACANLANLLLGRAIGRTREMAIRTALGVSRIRLLRLLITESCLLSTFGALAGIGLADWGLKAILTLSPADLPRLGDIKLDLDALGFALLLALVTGLVFGLAPALRTWSEDAGEALKEGGGRLGGSKRSALLRSVLTIAEIALSLVLLSGAVLLAETFRHVLGTDPGFNPSHVLSIEVWLNGSQYDTTAKVANFYQAVIERIQHLPGVDSAAVVAAGLPLERGVNISLVTEGKEERDIIDVRIVTPEYFRTLTIPLRAGRGFLETDKQEAVPVVLVNQSFVHKMLPNRNPLGQQVKAWGEQSSRQVVGVVGDVRAHLDGPAEPTIFIPIAQAPYRALKLFESWFATGILVRTTIDPLVLSRSVEEQLHLADPLVAGGHIRTMEQVRSAAVAARQFNMVLMAVFAGLAAVLAAVGIYGVMAYSVKQRTHEIGVRMALGAGRRDVLGMIYRQALVLTSLGIAIGTFCSLVLTRFLETYLYEIKPRDPVVFTGTALVLTTVAMFACAIPARRAAKVDPMVALRYE